MEIELWQLQNIIKVTSKEAVEQFIIHQNPTLDEINERKAFDEFGRGWVIAQVASGLVTPMRRGKHKNSPKIYSRSQLKSLKYGADPLLKSIYT